MSSVKEVDQKLLIYCEIAGGLNMLMKLVFDSAKKNYDSKVGFTLLPGAGVPEGA